MGAGAKATTMAPGMPKSGPRSRLIIACAECSSPLRSSNGLNAEKMRPWFGAAPEKLKPMTENTPSTSGVLSRIASACRAMPDVYSSDAPAGACTSVMK